MRAYSKRSCIICGKEITAAGAAFTSHMRMHVRQSRCIETKGRDGILRFTRIGNSAVATK